MFIPASIFAEFIDIISSMSPTSFKIGKQEFVVLPRKRYDQLTQAEEDRRDAEVAKKGRAAFLSGKMKPISHAEVKRKLSLKRR